MSKQAILSKSGLKALAGSVIISSLFLGSGMAMAADIEVMLSGAQEVPAVETKATGQGTITINDDMTVSGSVKTSDLDSTVAHIHEGAKGKNGPPIITLEKEGNDEWKVPAGAKLTEAQYKSYKAGNLYVNIHSDAHKGGEIRDQLKP